MFGPRYLPGELQQLVYGFWDENRKQIIYDSVKIQKIKTRTTNTLSAGFCSNCEVLNHCAGGCISRNMVITGNLYKPSKTWCEGVRYLAQKLPLDTGLFPCLHS